jgi:serine protease AprX
MTQFINFVKKNNMKSFTLLLFFAVLTLVLPAQIAPNKYFVRFTDKNNSPYSIDDPSEYLSQRAIDRRVNQGIAIDESDLPVNPSYLAGVAGTGATLINPSKWLNGVSVYTEDPSVIDAINALPYVLNVSRSPQINPTDKQADNNFEKPFFKHEDYNAPRPATLKQGNEIGVFDYGMGLNQIQQLNGDALHQMGYRGQGKVIAVLDAGFLNANTHDVFDSLWQNNQILGTHDFVRGGEIQFNEHPHGAMVLSCMGGNYPGQLIGTAPKASFWLLRSEDGDSEYIIEEYNWVSAAEYADSVGADVINSSLGYTEFNDPTQNHTYADMDGDTAPATIGADMVAKKGILVVNSLGNEGSSSWYYLSAPSDGDSVLGIGAVDGAGIYASFSSHGPSYDGRVKPDVVAQGSGVYVADPYGGGFTFSGGTSFSSPILAGMAACLWQANPSMDNMQVANAIRQSASQYDNPDDLLGYGIPDFIAANNILTVINGPETDNIKADIYPNPFKDSFTIDASLDGNNAAGVKDLTVEILDLTGRLIGIQKATCSGNEIIDVTLLKDSPNGIYFVKVSHGSDFAISKIVKE